ncbi:hypothetical protein GCM10009551_043770 [Nocardiopsis tropica]
MARFTEQLLDALGRNTGAYGEPTDDSEQPAIVAVPTVNHESARIDARGNDQGDTKQTDDITLEPEEVSLLAEIATGVTTEVAARHLGVDARTLRRRIRGICDKLDVNTPIEAVVWAARRQFI